MTDTKAMRAILAKAVTTEDDCQYYSMSQPFERTSEAHNFLRTYMKAAPAMLDEIDALRAENARLRDMIDWIGHDRRLSLSHYSPFYGDDDDQSEEWRVEKESGSINDREWTVIGRGQTPLAAITEARAALAQATSHE